jgi:hypothetical protein
MGHFQAVFSVAGAGYTPLARGWLHGTEHHRTQQASNVHHFLQLGLVWRLYSMAEYPGHAAATEPDMRCILGGCCMPSKEWSHTGPAVLMEGWPLGACCAVLRQCTARGRCGPFHSKRTTQSGVISARLATTQHLTWWGAAVPAGSSNVFMPLCCAMQRHA